eukprot:9380627-Lingulodinium_polyedra.AAC.1
MLSPEHQFTVRCIPHDSDIRPGMSLPDPRTQEVAVPNDAEIKALFVEAFGVPLDPLVVEEEEMEADEPGIKDDIVG